VRFRHKKSDLFAIRNLYLRDFEVFNKGLNRGFAIRNSGGDASCRFRAGAGNPEEKTAIL